MSLVIHILELLFYELGINLRRRYIGVAEHFLYRVDIRSVFEQVRSKGMTQRVRGDVLGYLRFLLIMLDYLPEALTRHALAADVYDCSAGMAIICGRTMVI